MESVLRVCLVCSAGGHLLQLERLRPWWERHERFWVTDDKVDARSLLRGEEVYWGHFPTSRSVKNFLLNLRLAGRLIRSKKPQLIISTGAGVAIPFFLVGRLCGMKCVYIEVIDRVKTPGRAGRLAYPLSSLFLVQWEKQRDFYPRAEVLGRLL
jgi:beta-1,4-N-acetylglucosaminyltransferase